MSTSENEPDIYYNLSPEFRDLIQSVKNEGQQITTPRDIIQRYNGSTRRGNKLTEEIELIFNIIGINTKFLLNDYGIDEEIELVSIKSRLRPKFRKIIEDTKNKGEITTTPRKLMEAYSGGNRTDRKINEVNQIFRLYGIEADDIHDCSLDLDIKLSSDENTENIAESIKEVSEEEPTKSNENDSEQGGIFYPTDIKDIIDPHPYQNDVMKELTKKTGNSIERSVAGILVLPTGAGKTLTAARWLLYNAINNKVRVLWLAHRHELLDQAAKTFGENAGIVKCKKEILIRRISGNENHDKPRHINGQEDIIIASVSALARNNNLKYLDKFLKGNRNDKFFLVIDEAHHAVAKTYQKIIKYCKSFKHLRILGLTATPYRTLKTEMGGLSYIFKDGVINQGDSADLQKLITQGYLAIPKHDTISTNLNVEHEIEFTEKDKDHIKKFKELPENIIDFMAKNSKRSKCIIDTYCNNKEKYGKTIIFALNRNDATAIDGLLKSKNIKSDHIISNEIQPNRKSVSSIENQEKIKKFRTGNLDVLVNVNILTEGTDIPNAQTIFLTRPTKSKTLMTQMVGRGMRGPKVGGKKYVNLVSFIDNWEQFVGWITPKELFPPSEIEDKTASPYERKIPYFLSEKMIQEYACMLYGETEEIKNLKFIERIPVGWYGFDITYLSKSDTENEGETDTTPISVLVYENQQDSYREFIENVANYKNIFINSDGIDMSDEELKKMEGLSDEIKTDFFGKCGSPLPPQENIMNILKYFIQTSNTPHFFTFEERDKFNIDEIAEHIINNDMGPNREKEYLNEQFEIPMWRQLYNNNFNAFRYFIRLLIYEKTDRKEDVNKSINIRYEQKNPKDIHGIPQEIREQVKERDGNKCLKCGSTKYLEIDHIKPFSNDGDTVLENLQTLCAKCHGEKGNTEISYIK